MTILFLSRLHEKGQTGGGALREEATQSLYHELKKDYHILYQQDISQKTTIASILKSYPYGSHTRTLFRSAKNVDLANYQTIHLEHIRQFQWIPANFNGKIIYNAHNLEHEIYYPRTESRQKSKFINYEISCMRRCHIILVCSDREKHILCQLAPDLSNKIIVFPNMVKAENYQYSDFKNIILFVGTLDYYPNVKAIEFLCQDFFPKIAKKYSGDFDFIVAGRNPTVGLKEKIESVGAKLVSDLSAKDMQSLLSKTYLSLVPLSEGSGTRLKIIESIFSQAYVLSTPLGSEGIQSSMIINRELEEFVKAFEEIIEKKVELPNPETERELFKDKYDLISWLRLHSKEIGKKIE